MSGDPSGVQSWSLDGRSPIGVLGIPAHCLQSRGGYRREFTASWVFIQGDSMSPIIFNIMLDAVM